MPNPYIKKLERQLEEYHIKCAQLEKQLEEKQPLVISCNKMFMPNQENILLSFVISPNKKTLIPYLKEAWGKDYIHTLGERVLACMQDPKNFIGKGHT